MVKNPAIYKGDPVDSKNPQSEENLEYLEDDIEDAVLQTILKRAYQLFRVCWIFSDLFIRIFFVFRFFVGELFLFLFCCLFFFCIIEVELSSLGVRVAVCGVA